MIPSESNSERLTRKRLIDPKLKAAGWKIVALSARKPLISDDPCAIEEFETANGPADYALCIDGQIIAVVEAKKLTISPQGVLMQAERYGEGITNSPFNYRGFRVPFLYSTNGEVIWHHDIRHELSRSHVISQFHTPEALMERLQKDFDTSCQTLLNTQNDHPRLRPYQREANAAIEKAIADRKEKMLVAMATGTGKTFTMVVDDKTIQAILRHSNVAVTQACYIKTVSDDAVTAMQKLESALAFSDGSQLGKGVGGSSSKLAN